MTSVSTLSMSSTLRLSTAQVQAALTQDQTELATGTPADIGLTLGGDTGALTSLKSQIDQMNGYTNSNETVGTRLSATSSALSSILSEAQSMVTSLTTASSAGGLTPSVQTSAQNALQSLTSGLNTSVGGESVFGGINTSKTTIADYFSTTTSAAKQAVDTAFSSEFGTSQTSSSASTITSSQITSFLDNQFGSLFSASGWQNWSSASDTTMQTTIAPSQTATTSVSANDVAFRQIAEAYTMVSEFTGSSSGLSSSVQTTVVAKAASLLNSGLSALTDVQENVGAMQDTVDAANTQISAQVNVLQANVSNVDSVDTAALSSQLTTLETQLEASYEMTSRLQSLSLTSYLSS